MTSQAQAPKTTAIPAVGAEIVEDGVRVRRSGLWIDIVVALLTAMALLLAINHVFNLRFFIGVTLLQNSYLYALGGIFLCIVYLVFPASGRGSPTRVPIHDIALAAIALACGGYLTATGETSLYEGWEYMAPRTPTIVSFVFWALIIEATRRSMGMMLAVIVLAFSLYPIVADVMPGPIAGFAQPIEIVIPYHILSNESSFGIPMNAFGGLVIGFVLFGAALQHTGGGRFFNNLAFALVGGYRGGAAKVACLGSGLMGSMSGSVISNVLTTGAVSIPAMRRTGFSRPQAAGVEACASTGGVLMPPIMGATAFVMASFLGVPYSTIVLAAIIPSALYYFGMVVQIDAYAAKRNLKGLPRNELPSIAQTLREGWQYVVVFVFLIVMLVGFQQEVIAPFLATALLLVINQLFRHTRLNASQFLTLLARAGTALAEMAAILVGVGLIVGAFSATGLAGTLANDLVFLAGGATLTLLAMGALTSFIFGMGMTVTSCYIFLAVVLAPALIRAGLDPLAVHLFIMYWGMVSFITPPVALGAFAAASIANTSPMKAGLAAMRLGSIIYVLPFFFVLEPALIGRGEPMEILLVGALAFAGVWLIASALQGYLVGYGSLGEGASAMMARGGVALGGLIVAMPGTLVPGLNHWQLAAIGAAVAIASVMLSTIGQRATR